jgi:hypothetical protein
MTKGEETAYPIVGSAFSDNYQGLTKREYFAGLAMQGLLANQYSIDKHNEAEINWIAKHSIMQADELLKQLEQ